MLKRFHLNIFSTVNGNWVLSTFFLHIFYHLFFVHSRSRTFYMPFKIDPYLNIKFWTMCFLWIFLGCLERGGISFVSLLELFFLEFFIVSLEEIHVLCTRFFIVFCHPSPLVIFNPTNSIKHTWGVAIPLTPPLPRFWHFVIYGSPFGRGGGGISTKFTRSIVDLMYILNIMIDNNEKKLRYTK